MNRIYACIDLKSFYASVECVERKLNPLTTNLVVADNSRTNKTICLALTPSLKQYGLSGRSRLYEVVQTVSKINRYRRSKIRSNFISKSYDDIELKNNKLLELDYIVAVPRMKYYMRYSARIYNVYLKYVAPEDIFVYSIDEVFIDITNYLKLYKLEPRELVTKMIQDVYKTTNITATGGIGTNLYLAKVAMDIVAKHVDADEYGVRVAEIDEKSYREKLWDYRPLTDFWRVGKGLSKRLEKIGLYTMGDVARYSLENENHLFKVFGVNAEFLIDHAWGWEPCTMKAIKNFKPQTNSLSSGQVLHEPYTYQKTKIIVKEMTELLTLDMVEKGYVTDQIVLTVGYDISNLTDTKILSSTEFEVVKDFYGRSVPKAAHGTIRLDHKTSSTKIITEAVMKLFEKIINIHLLTRRINIAVCNLDKEENVKNNKIYKQFDLFSDNEMEDKNQKEEKIAEENEKKIQKTVLEIKNKYGKNAILKGMNLEEGATTIDRNKQVGGHRG